MDLYGHLIPGGNKQAVDRLDFDVEERSLRPESATPAQPAPVFPGAMSTDQLQSPAVTRKGAGVDDGFRISSNPSDHQQDPALPIADGGKIEQAARKSATDCNQDFSDQEGLAHDKSGETEKR